MASAVTIIAQGPRSALGREVLAEITLSGNYATDGEALNAGDFGGSSILAVTPHGMAMASDESTGIPVQWDPTAQKLIAFEAAAAGAAFTEKNNAEAYPTGCYVRASVLVR